MVLSVEKWLAANEEIFEILRNGLSDTDAKEAVFTIFTDFDLAADEASTDMEALFSSIQNQVGDLNSCRLKLEQHTLDGSWFITLAATHNSLQEGNAAAMKIAEDLYSEFKERIDSTVPRNASSRLRNNLIDVLDLIHEAAVRAAVQGYATGYQCACHDAKSELPPPRAIHVIRTIRPK